MAKLIDKDAKRKEIAFLCRDILLERGIKNITVSELAKVAGIGKGTIYEYFNNKEDIVFEIVNKLIEEYNKNLLKKIDKAKNTYEKLLIFFEFFYEDNRFINHYKEFLAISLTNPSKEMLEFKTKTKKFYYSVLENILKKGIQNKELKKGAVKLKKIIYNMAIGLFIETQTTNLVEDKKKEFEKELMKIYQLIRNEK